LAAIPAYTLLYKVHAVANPGSPKVHIGDLTITSELVGSYFGDKYLFFKHQDMEEDIAFRPEWKTHLEVGSTSLGCPISFIREAA
jgi:hypothetical protein